MTDSALLSYVTDALADWLPSQRWFAGKDRPVNSVRAVSSTELVAGDPRLLHLIIEVDQGGAAADRYQLLAGARADLPDYLVHWQITVVEGLAVYDGLHDHDLAGRLLELINDEAAVGDVRFATLPEAKIDPTLRSRSMSVEQSNTSLVYGQQYILKLFRRLQPGLSPDLEVHRALHRVGCEHIAAPLGWIETAQPPSGDHGIGSARTYANTEPTTLGMLSEFLPNVADGWAMATASVRDLMAEGDLHADEVGGDFAAEAHRLGTAVATVHADLDAALGHTDGGAEELAAKVDTMHDRLDRALSAVPALAEHEAVLRAVFEAARQAPRPFRLQRIHGDLHLGQALRTPTHWVLIDFEGEPMKPMADRRAPGSPLRDVAGVLRSFDYAAHQMLVGHGPDRPLSRQHTVRALEWSRRNRTAFLDGYAEVGAGVDLERDAALLRALELDKAVYEVCYELANRPDWMPIPLASIARLTADRG